MRSDPLTNYGVKTGQLPAGSGRLLHANRHDSRGLPPLPHLALHLRAQDNPGP